MLTEFYTQAGMGSQVVEYPNARTLSGIFAPYGIFDFRGNDIRDNRITIELLLNYY